MDVEDNQNSIDSSKTDLAEKWKMKYDWLFYQVKNMQLILKCQLCIKHKKCKVFTTGAINKIAKDVSQHSSYLENTENLLSL
jgi:hypothetical protein